LIALEALLKKVVHLSMLSKTNRANPNVAAGLCGSTEMHLRSEARKRDRRARKLKLRHEDATQSTNILTRLFHSFVLLDACPCLALKLLIRMTSKLRRSFRKVAEFCLCKQSHNTPTLHGNFLKSILFWFLVIGFAIAFLVKLSLDGLHMRPNSFSALSKRRYWLTGLNISAQLAIHSVNVPFGRKHRISVARNPLGTGSPCFSSAIPASNWANHLGLTLNGLKHSIAPWLAITSICLRKSLRRMGYLGRMCIIWMRKAVREVGVGKLHHKNILCLERSDRNIKSEVRIWSWSPLLSVSVQMAKALLLDLSSRRREIHSAQNGLRFSPTSGKCCFSI
jgi:hypothetical protein